MSTFKLQEIETTRLQFVTWIEQKLGIQGCNAVTVSVTIKAKPDDNELSEEAAELLWPIKISREPYHESPNGMITLELTGNEHDEEWTNG